MSLKWQKETKDTSGFQTKEENEIYFFIIKNDDTNIWEVCQVERHKLSNYRERGGAMCIIPSP